MNNSSQYTFPIFISSTDYNLKDLRAELARYLTELGYRPILSSSNGFPDNSPKLEPWESCLKVLDRSFVMVLIIDGRYGQKLNWPNYKNIFNGNKYSPTHGEYIYAHSLNKRMLVFIRKEIMVYYSLYRKAKQKNSDPEKLKSSIESLLPDHIDFDVFEFINKVKTTKPIPWINEFEDITLIKQEIQMKMINELAEVFMIQNKRFETIVDAFDKAMESIDPEKREEILNKLNSTRELTKAKEELVHKKEELEIAKKGIESTKKVRKSDNKDKENKIKALNDKIGQMEDQIEAYEASHNKFIFKKGNVHIEPSSLLLSDYTLHGDTVVGNTLSGLTPFMVGTGVNLNLGGSVNSIVLPDETCSKCGMIKENDSNLSASVFSGDLFRFCPSCDKNYCYKCWPINSEINCPDCSSKD